MKGSRKEKYEGKQTVTLDIRHNLLRQESAFILVLCIFFGQKLQSYQKYCTADCKYRNALVDGKFIEILE